MNELKGYFVTLKTGRFSKRSWLEDYAGIRLTPKFKVKYHETVGPITRLITDKGSYVYTEEARNYLHLFKSGSF